MVCSKQGRRMDQGRSMDQRSVVSDCHWGDFSMSSVGDGAEGCGSVDMRWEPGVD
jgi:nitrite reductase/ring-hydroxylating ferredoxin subunit